MAWGGAQVDGNRSAVRSRRRLRNSEKKRLLKKTEKAFKESNQLGKYALIN